MFFWGSLLPSSTNFPDEVNEIGVDSCHRVVLYCSQGRVLLYISVPFSVGRSISKYHWRQLSLIIEKPDV